MQISSGNEDPLDEIRALKAQNIRLADYLLSLQNEAGAQRKVFYGKIQEFSTFLATTKQLCLQNQQYFDQYAVLLGNLQQQLYNRQCELIYAQERQQRSELEILELREQLQESQRQTYEYLRLFLEAQGALDDSYGQIDALQQNVAYSSEQIACYIYYRDEALSAMQESMAAQARCEQYKMLILSLKKKVQDLRKQLKNYAAENTMETLYTISHSKTAASDFSRERPKSSSWTPFEIQRSLQAMSATEK